MFEQTRKIVEKTEAHIVGFRYDNETLNFGARLVWFPLQYLWLGLKEYFKPAKVGYVLLMVLWGLSHPVAKQLQIADEYYVFIIYGGFLGALFFTMFAMPSTYVFSGVSKNLVDSVVNIMKNQQVNTKEDIELIEKNIEKIGERISSRIAFYKWLVGVAWGVYIFSLNVEMRFLVKLDGDALTKAISNNLTPFIIMMMSTIFALLIVVGYKKASDLLVKSIEFACIEYQYQLRVDEKNQ